MLNNALQHVLIEKPRAVLLQDLKDAQDTFKQNMPAAEDEFRSILALGEEVASLAKGAENPYTLITTNVCINCFCAISFCVTEYNKYTF